MSFEIVDRDLMARIGKFESKSGVVETPQLLPVVNPNVQTVLPKSLEEEFDCSALITNAYIMRKKHREAASERGLHDFLDFQGTIMTDSGAYQLLVYKGVETTPKEIVHFQEAIDTDIATILDIPTGWAVTKKYAQQTVDETIKRAKALSKMKTRSDIAWVGPVQGGKYLDLVAKSAREMGKLPFQIHALGSPTPIMEQYKFDTLVDMIMAAKMNLPPERPLHLFGAGHPFMFALVVALGGDFFDSAAYALFAREDRYMTEYGTARLSELKYLPCSCPVCCKNDPESVRALPKGERQKVLAEHNLYVSFGELRRIKQAITEGRLWEHLEIRAHGHPSLLQAVKRLGKYSGYMEETSPVTKRSGIFYFTSLGLARPEVVRHRKRMSNRYSPPPKAKILLLLPQTQTRPFHTSKEIREILKKIQPAEIADKINVCVYAAPFGVVPLELSEVYPLSQYEIASPLDSETVNYVAEQVSNYIDQTNYEKIILLRDSLVWRGTIATACRQSAKKSRTSFTVLREREPWAEKTIEHLATIVREAGLQP